MIDNKEIIKNIPTAIKSISFSKLGKRSSGKVRDWYIKNGLRILITTDRISAFDKVVGTIPFRGAVLNKLSQFWFDKTRDIIQNHMIGVIDPNIMLVSEAKALPIEVVVRGYITGITDTSLWKNYQDGKRVIYGINFPEGLVKNQKLKNPLLTPTTRETSTGGHDEPITVKEILKQKLVSPAIWRLIEKVSIKLYERGLEICDKKGFILPDTKYEFGLDRNGKLILIDEIHTPDSSRYWQKKSYTKKFNKGEEIENFDKEYMRQWLKKQGYSGNGKIPKMPPELVAKISKRYIQVYEKITEEKFDIDVSIPQKDRVLSSISKLV